MPLGFKTVEDRKKKHALDEVRIALAILYFDIMHSIEVEMIDQEYVFEWQLADISSIFKQITWMVENTISDLSGELLSFKRIGDIDCFLETEETLQIPNFAMMCNAFRAEFGKCQLLSSVYGHLWPMKPSDVMDSIRKFAFEIVDKHMSPTGGTHQEVVSTRRRTINCFNAMTRFIYASSNESRLKDIEVTTFDGEEDHGD